MTLAKEMREVADEHLTNVEQLSDDVLVGDKEYNNHRYARVVLTQVSALDKWASELNQRQDELLGPIFYSSSPDEQRNLYLYLVVDNGNVPAQAKRQIEQDRRFARKRVVSIDELKNWVDWRSWIGDISVASDASLVNELQESLVQSRLDALLEKVPLSGLLDRLIDDVSQLDRKPIRRTLAASHEAPSVTDNVLANEWLQTLDLESYRAFPKGGPFSFGRVNLITGANGTGKTSLLEAIEFLYCGSNLRGKSGHPYIVSGRLGSSCTEVQTIGGKHRAASRNRNRWWYGRFDPRVSTLEKSFAQFNFLNSDAAFALSRDGRPNDVTQSLERLIAGESVAELWLRIDRVLMEVPSRTRSLRTLVTGCREQIDALKKELSAASSAPSESDGSFAVFQEQLKAIGWKVIPQTKSETEKVIERIESGYSTTLKATEFGAAHGHIEIGHVRERQEAYKSLISNLEALCISESEALGQVKRIQQNSNRLRARREMLEEFNIQVLSGFGSLLIQKREVAEELQALQRGIRGADFSDLNLDLSQFTEAPVDEAITMARVTKEQAEGEFNRLSTELKSLKDRLDEKVNVHTDLRVAAQRLFEIGNSTEICPLCSAKHDPEELQRRVFGEGRTVAESEQAKLEEKVLRAKVELQMSLACLGFLSALSKFCVQSFGDEAMPVHIAKERWRSAMARKATLEDLFYSLKEQIEAIESGGVSESRFSSLATNLELSWDVQEDSLTQALHLVEQEYADLEQQMGSAQQALDQARTSAWAKAGAFLPDSSSQLSVVDLTNVVKGLAAGLDALSDAIAKLQEHAALDVNHTLNIVIAALESCLESGNKVKRWIEHEKTTGDKLQKARKALGERLKEMEKASRDLNAVQAVGDVLESMKSKYSLASLTEQLARQVETEMRGIFSRIHTPYEYEVHVGQDHFLKEVAGSEFRRLEEVSTGQRAAFALSVFLALNRSAVQAPPVILMDDPIAHVDDLNAVAFLDYLRELAIKGNKQIFFATADAQVAGMFQYKFNFLGGDFRHIALSRAPSA